MQWEMDCMTTLEIDRLIGEYSPNQIQRIIRKKSGEKRTFESKSRRERASLVRRDGSKCYYCETKFTKNDPPTVDHYFPAAFCKANRLPKVLWDNISNKVLACRSCNQLKAHSIPKMSHYYAWLNRILSMPYPNPRVLLAARVAMNKATFYRPFLGTQYVDSMVDREVIEFDSELSYT